MKMTDNGKNNCIEGKVTPECNLTIEFNGDNNTLVVAEGCTFPNMYIRFQGNNNTVVFNENTRWSGRFVLNGDEQKIEIGNNCHANGFNIIAEEGQSVSIGNDCYFMHGIEARTSDSHAMLSIETGDRTNPAKGITVGDSVFIDKGASLLPGAQVSNGSVVALGTILSREVSEENCLISGNPGRPTKKGISWERAGHDKRVA